MSAFRAILDQLATRPPHAQALGMQLEALDGTAVTLSLPWREDLVGDPETGVVAGGVVSALLDHASGLAVWAAIEDYQAIATLDMRIDYMRAAEPGLAIKARAEVFRLTQAVAFVRGVAYDVSPDEPVAAVQAAFMLNSDGGRKAGANLKADA